MTITLNGDPFDTDATTISALLERLDIDPRRVAVERNFVVVKRDAYEGTPVETGDQIEIVNFVGGGSAARRRSLLAREAFETGERRSGYESLTNEQ